MRKQKSKKVFIYFFLFLSIVSLNNKNLINANFVQVNKISIKGLDEKSNLLIKKEINKLSLNNLFFIDKVKIIKIIRSNNLVENFSVFKIYPSSIDIKIDQTKFLAKLKKGEKNYILGSNGKLIENKNEIDVPFIYGAFEEKNFFKLKKAIDDTNFNYNDIKSLFSFKSGRWDIETKNGVLILLPKDKIKESLELYLLFSKQNHKREINKFDLRQYNQVITNG
tara:strand:+ start:109 stop:777 length:669 start_codon:yes stop_codon:yes gene_type:complete